MRWGILDQRDDEKETFQAPLELARVNCVGADWPKAEVNGYRHHHLDLLESGFVQGVFEA
jgi:hypothetical protein